MRKFRPFGERAVRSLSKCFLSAPGVKWLPAFISLFLIASGTFAQTFPPASSCTSKELDWLEGLLQSGASINSLTPGNRRMNLTVKNATTSDRRSFAVWGTLNRYDSYGTLKGTQRVFFCVDSVKKNSTLTLASKDSVYYGQDEILEMTNIYTAWSSSSGKENCDFLFANTANISPRCAVKSKMNVYTGVNARLHPNRAACGNGKGLLKAIPFGGKGPYTISVTQEGSSAQVTQIVNDRDSFNFELPPGIYKITVIDGKYNSNVFTREIQAPLPIDKPTFNAGHPSCTIPNGWVNVINKGVGFAYHLRQNGNTITTTADGNFPDVASGDYQLVAVRGSCNSSDSVKINRRPTIPGKPQFVITHPNCDKSKGFINISNIEENVVYNLTQNGIQKFTTSNGIFSDIDPGAYDLIAQGASCKNQDTLSVNPQPVRPNKPQFNVTHPNCIRARGLIELTNNDNNNSYQLKQNGQVKYTASAGNIDEVETGDYEIVATRGACSNADSVKVNKRPFIPGKPNFSITHPSCTRGKGYVTLNSTESDVTYTMKVNDQVAYTADEYGVFSEVDPGSYTIHANASICSNSDNATVNPQPPTPVAPTLSVTAPSFCNATGSVVITAPTGNNLDYSSDGGTTWVSSNEFSGLAAGTGSSMSFKVRNAHQCVSPAATICTSPEAPAVANTIVGAQQTSGKYLGSAELTEASVTVKTIPNPFNTKVRFVIASPEAGNGVLELYNIQGQKVKTIFQGRISAGTNFFDLSMPNSRRGEYIYVLRMGEKQISGKLLQLENSKY